jgi:hypothetical protein
MESYTFRLLTHPERPFLVKCPIPSDVMFTRNGGFKRNVAKNTGRRGCKGDRGIDAYSRIHVQRLRADD